MTSERHKGQFMRIVKYSEKVKQMEAIREQPNDH